MSDRRMARGGRLAPGLLAAASFAGLIAVVFADPLFSSRIFASRDMLPFFLPIEKAVHEAWRSGHVPLWMENVSFGRPLAANPNTGVFYPVRIGMALLPFPVAFKLFPLLHLWIAALGAWMLARELGTTVLGAYAAGATYALGGPALSEIFFIDFLPGLALLPWALWAGLKLTRVPGSRMAAVLAISLALMLLAGDVFTVGLAVIGSTLLLVQESDRATAPRARGWFLVALVLAGVLGAIQIVPALFLTPYTVRALGRFTVGLALTWSVSLWRGLEYLIAFPFGNAAASPVVWGTRLWSGKSAGFFNTLYAGAFAALSPWIVSLRGRRRHFFLGFPLISTALAVAGYYVPQKWRSAASPIPLRYPEKFMVGTALTLAVFSGLALDRLRRNPRIARRGAAVAAMFAVILGLGAVISRASPSATSAFVAQEWDFLHHWENIAAVRLPAIFGHAALRWAALAGLLFLWNRPRARLTTAALAIFIAVDLASLRAAFVYSLPEWEGISDPPAARVVRHITRHGLYGYLPLMDYFGAQGSKDALNEPWVPETELVRQTLMSDFGAAFGVRYAFNQDYDASDLYRVDLARNEIYRDEGRSPGLAHYLAAYSVSCAVVVRGMMPNGFTTAARSVANRWVVVNPQALPGIRFIRKCEDVPAVGDAYRLIHTERHDLLESDVVETGGRKEESLSPGRVSIEAIDGNRLRVRTTTAGAARVVLPLAPLPFRRVTVDGRPANADPTDLCLVSVAIPAGRHVVEVDEELPGRSLGPSLSACGLLSLGLLFRRRRPRAN